MTASAEPLSTGRIALVISALALGSFAIGTTEFAAMSLLPFYAADFDVTEPVAAHAVSAYALGVVVGAPVLALFGASWPRRRLLVTLMTLISLGNAATVMAPNYTALLAFRFLSGLPHGAYFGVAALLAASLIPRKRATATSYVMAGLAVATVIGAPFANWLGLNVGWRVVFAGVSAIALTTAVAVQLLAPLQPADAERSFRRELRALARPQVLLTLGAGAVGFGGLFAVYSFLAPVLTEYTGVAPSSVPWIFVIFGLGILAGNLLGGWMADISLKAAAVGLLLWSALFLAAFTLVASNVWLLSIVCFAIGMGGGLGPILQVRLMDVAGEAQTLAAALHHAAFNLANALGPWLAGLAITAGMGWTAPGWIGLALALSGVIILLVSFSKNWSGRRMQKDSSTT
ncbi:MAG: MFS transporter [Altererythrobacter sp.]|nr:MFS transporter [Altererythrobacter sp.]MBK62320.1 MFS transporter [Altererythrobacter sp.]|tara:strand:- start:12824 stop:14029 length:1206 start_codon:yes stop_codon:yes gene_type:complete